MTGASHDAVRKGAKGYRRMYMNIFYQNNEQ
jgi:hypothetical protein